MSPRRVTTATACSHALPNGIVIRSCDDGFLAMDLPDGRFSEDDAEQLRSLLCRGMDSASVTVEEHP